MLLRPQKQLADILVELLGRRVGANAQLLHDEVVKRYRPCSIQGIYHELRRLQEDGVVLKAGNSYHLSISWASELMEFADHVYDNYIGSASALAILPEKGKRLSWRFSNLLRLDDLWMQAMQVFFRETKSPTLYAWNAYPWFYFAQPDKVTHYYEFVRRENRRFCYILGEDTFLSRLYAEGISKDIFSYSFAAPPFSVSENTYFTCVPPYLLQVEIDSETCKRIATLFHTVTSERDMKFVTINRALNQPARLKISIEHNERKTKKLHRQFEDFFGL